MNTFVIHGHFYQPYRANPYVGDVMIEDTAYPYENWNERIYRECYLPNAYAHLRVDTKVKAIINNYTKMSFNFGWPLLDWMEKNHPELLDKIREGAENAIATSFNHTILPLDPQEDKEIQLFWGIRAFEKFFGRRPTGFWLPELAIDKQIVHMLIKYGIKYILLAPHQTKVRGSFLRYYAQDGHLGIFVYDGELSQGIAFGDLLSDAKSLLETLRSRRGLTIIAADGETFGHHKKFGEMGLAYMFANSSEFKSLEAYYKENMPKLSTDINWNTSWSCPHGVERWRSDCGCSTGGLPGWHQKWRKPLRDGLEAVRSRIKEMVYNKLEEYFFDVHGAILGFVDVILGASKDEYFSKYLKRDINKEEKVKILKLLNAIKYIQLAFSSDGWFFAEISGIEPVKNLLFAKRAIELIEDSSIERTLLRYLEEAPSNIQAYGNGLGVWKNLVLTQVYSPQTISRTALILHISELKDKKDRLGKWEFEVLEESKIRLIDTETEEELSFEEDLTSFDVSMLPSLYAKHIFEKWAMDYIKEEEEFLRDYEFLLEDMVLHSKSLRFRTAQYMREKLRLLLKSKLLILIKEKASTDKIKEILTKADTLSVDVRDEHIAQELTSYVVDKAIKAGDEELLRLLEFAREYNLSVTRYELAIDLWQVQNIVWERRQAIKNDRIFELLNILSFSS
ncbi:MAG: DUF3536 domain-containing protein [Hydrogenobacter thermophilus]|nr:DUF3536 domain-containing protein [Hydrogenobacter thermophilus]